jgi:hypothetical protein
MSFSIESAVISPITAAVSLFCHEKGKRRLLISCVFIKIFDIEPRPSLRSVRILTLGNSLLLPGHPTSVSLSSLATGRLLTATA